MASAGMGRGSNSFLTERNAAGIGIRRSLMVDSAGNPIVFGDPTSLDFDFNTVGGVAIGHLGDNLVLADTPAIPTNSTAYFKDGSGNSKAVSSANPFPVTFDGGEGDVNLVGLDGQAIGVIGPGFGIIPTGTKAVYTGSATYGYSHGDNQFEVITGVFDQAYGHAYLGSALSLLGDDSNGSIPVDYVDNNGFGSLSVNLAGNGNSFRTDVLAVGGGSLDGNNGLVVNSATADGYGNLIGSASSSLLATNALYTDLALYTQVDGDVNKVQGAYPGDWFAGNAVLTQGAGMIGVVSLDAIGGVATYPAFTPSGGVDNTLNPMFQGVGAISMGYAPTEDYYLPNTTSFEADGSFSNQKYALDTSLIFWGPGGTAVAPAQDLNGVIYTLNSPMNAPLTLGVVAGYDPTFASIQGVTTNQGIGADYYPIGLDINQALWGGTAVSAAKYPLDGDTWDDTSAMPGVAALAMFDNGSAQSQTVSADTPMPVNTPEGYVTSGVVIATNTFTIASGKILKDFTCNAIWTGSPTADTFTCTLEGSFLGTYTGSDLVVLRTMNASDLADGISNVPYPHSRLNLSALSLVTATGITVTGVGSK